MAAFKALNWSPNEVLDEPKLDTLSGNLDYLFANTPRALYTVPGIARTEGVKLVSGKAVMGPAPSNSSVVTVTFGNYFSNGCQPNITTGVISNRHKMIFDSYWGIGKTIPDHTGFQIQIVFGSPNNKVYQITGTPYVAWMAMGY